MTEKVNTFDLENFLPYLLNQAAEVTSQEFQKIYSEKYGLTKTQWRVLAHLGKYGEMTAKDICQKTHTDKTKVSRAVSALENTQILKRVTKEIDKRFEKLSLTPKGEVLFFEIGKNASGFDLKIREELGLERVSLFIDILKAFKNNARS